jgi:serine protease inhibitor
MRRLLAILLCGMLLLTAACAPIGRILSPGSAGALELPAKGDPKAEVDERLPAANDAFGFRLLQAMPSDGPNTLLSPFSVTSALAMTANGANDRVRAAMEKTLGLDAMGLPAANVAYADLLARLQTGTPESQLAIANSLWLREGAKFKPAFLATNRDYYAAEASTLRFGGIDANKKIDGWVNDRTRGLIPQLFGDAPIDKDTLLVLVDALYFKADWKEAFDPQQTQPETFTPQDGSPPFRVPMMHQTAEFGYLTQPRFDAVRLPYKDGKRAMYVFVPKASAADGMVRAPAGGYLGEFLRQLDGPTWERWMRNFHETKVLVGLPKMKLKSRTDLSDPLVVLGMEPAFQGGFDDLAVSDLSKPIGITDIVHAVTVEVDEKGTKAAAATGVTMGVTAAAESAPPAVVADRPFFFAIRDEASGVVLFAGAVRDPR